ncbi:transglycosylase SLT domain-containing protein [Vibrio superstes]|uniref:Transglycosylase SLT domain-containing protein n=1 Tax=Vibrio superstes NBRC 103154 TaxID=1219062 RepID=A0A511QKH5_9VIBR|nr:transglycosylase SLT domain-containing protein [Vibrio superstes]GEM77828.1 hypothetical protein VSU01S_00730 [Vibrio superstes NBRC 103154]
MTISRLINKNVGLKLSALLIALVPLLSNASYQDAQATIKEQFQTQSTANQRHYQQQVAKSKAHWADTKTDKLRYATYYSADLQTRTTEDYQSKTLVIETIDDSSTAKQAHQSQVQRQIDDIVEVQQSNTVTTEVVSRKGERILTTRITPQKQYWDNKALVYLDDIKMAAKQWQVPPSLILAIIYNESRFNPNAVSKAPAYGLMQIMEKSAAADVSNFFLDGQKIPNESLMNPILNIQVGSAYLHILTEKYLKDIESEHSRLLISIAAYNAGIGAVAKHFTKTTSIERLRDAVNRTEFKQLYQSLTKQFPYSETRHYVSAVVDKEHEYKKLLESTSNQP